METFLIFLAIIAIQMIAAYSKQKKEAAKRQQQQQAPHPAPEYKETYEEYEYEEPEKFEEPRKETAAEGVRPSQPEVPFRPITDRTQIKKAEPKHEDLPKAQKLRIHQAININDPGQGVLWTAILQEPRYKVKWKRR